MKKHFADKFCKSVECEKFCLQYKHRLPIQVSYIFDKKRECLIIRQDIGAILLQEKKDEDEANMMSNILCVL